MKYTTEILDQPPLLPTDRVYLMSPYSATGEDAEAVQTQRFQDNTIVATMLMMAHGCSVFSPVAHSHLMGVLSERCQPGSLPWSHWMKLDIEILSRFSNCGLILMIDGWKDSSGVAMECHELTKLGLPIFGCNLDMSLFYKVTTHA